MLFYHFFIFGIVPLLAETSLVRRNVEEDSIFWLKSAESDIDSAYDTSSFAIGSSSFDITENLDFTTLFAPTNEFTIHDPNDYASLEFADTVLYGSPESETSLGLAYNDWSYLEESPIHEDTFEYLPLLDDEMFPAQVSSNCGPWSNSFSEIMRRDPNDDPDLCKVPAEPGESVETDAETEKRNKLCPTAFIPFCCDGYVYRPRDVTTFGYSVTQCKLYQEAPCVEPSLFCCNGISQNIIESVNAQGCLTRAEATALGLYLL